MLDHVPQISSGKLLVKWWATLHFQSKHNQNELVSLVQCEHRSRESMLFLALKAKVFRIEILTSPTLVNRTYLIFFKKRSKFFKSRNSFYYQVQRAEVEKNTFLFRFSYFLAKGLYTRDIFAHNIAIKR